MLSGQNTRVLLQRGCSNNCGLFPVQITTTLHVLSSQLSVSVTRINGVENTLRAGYVAHKTAGVLSFKLQRIGSLNKEHRESHHRYQSWAVFGLT